MLDSATITQIGQIAGQVAGQVATQTGHGQFVNLITTVLSAVSAVAIYILGHLHGKSSTPPTTPSK